MKVNFKKHCHKQISGFVVHLKLRRSQKFKTANLPQILLQLVAGIEQRDHLALLLISTTF
jgi:hypothetical protein